MRHTVYWPKAFGISCIVHLVLFVTLGFLAGQLDAQQPPAEYIMVDLTLSSHIQGGGSSMLTATAQPATTTAPARFAPTASPSVSPISPPVQSEISQPSRVSDTGLVAAAGGDLRVASNNLVVNSGATAASAGDAAAGNAANSSGSTTGSNSGSGVGSGIGAGSGPGIDGAILAFLAEIEKHKEYPYIARKRGLEGVVTLIVELSAAGELNRVQIAQSSGSSQLDDAAAIAIRRVCPFPHGLGHPVGMKIPISYRLLQ